MVADPGGVEDGGAESASDGAIEAAVIGTCSNPTELDSCPDNTTCASDVSHPRAGCWDEIDPSVATSVWCCAGLIPPDAGAAPPFTGCPSAVPVACQEGWFGYIIADACNIPDSWTGCYDGIIAPYDPAVDASATQIYCCPLSDAGAAESSVTHSTTSDGG
jgi:hypothetical protein